MLEYSVKTLIKFLAWKVGPPTKVSLIFHQLLLPIYMWKMGIVLCLVLRFCFLVQDNFSRSLLFTDETLILSSQNLYPFGAPCRCLSCKSLDIFIKQITHLGRIKGTPPFGRSGKAISFGFLCCNKIALLPPVTYV